jgi:antitoxin HicB
MLQYPVSLEQDSNGTVLVSFPDIPEAHTYGADAGDALARAADALETAFGAVHGLSARHPQPVTPAKARECGGAAGID